MDDVLTEEQQSFEQRLNKRCDELAKEAVDCAGCGAQSHAVAAS